MIPRVLGGGEPNRPSNTLGIVLATVDPNRPSHTRPRSSFLHKTQTVLATPKSSFPPSDLAQLGISVRSSHGMLSADAMHVLKCVPLCSSVCCCGTVCVMRAESWVCSCGTACEVSVCSMPSLHKMCHAFVARAVSWADYDYVDESRRGERRGPPLRWMGAMAALYLGQSTASTIPAIRSPAR